MRHLAWLALAVLACYANALFGDFQFDDYKVIVDNPSVHSWAGWLDNLGRGIRPLLKLSYTLNWVSGWGVAGFHATNLLIHLGNAFLVYALADQFLRSQTLPSGTDRQPVALLTALLFAVHPIHTEAVTYVCGRSTSLMALLYLGGVLAYALGRTRQQKRYLYGLSPALFVAALSVKETAVTFPLALLAWELACGGSWRGSLQRQWPSWTVWLGGAVFFLLSDSYLGHMQRSTELNTLQGNAATQVLAFGYLMRQWAVPLWLNIDPDLPLRHGFSGLGLPLLFLLGCLGLMAVSARTRPWISFALAWAMLQLVPLYLFLPRLDVANDRQMYLADWPLYMALCTELALWTRTQVFRVTAAAVLITLGALTIARNAVYDTETTLWEDTVRKSPDKARVHNNLGYAYKLSNRPDDARREFTVALQLDPQHIKARYNLDRLNNP
jgi:hypothetical protein